MKTTYYFLGALAMFALASCSNDQETEFNKTGSISFRSAIGTRATETTTANLKEFKVSAFLNNAPFFNSLTFTKGEDDLFVSSPVYNWPGDGSNLDFYAYSPMNPRGTLTLNDNQKVLADFSPETNPQNQVDFITADTIGNKDTNAGVGVPLTFKHRLSQIVVRAKSDNKAYIFKVTGVKIANVKSTGSFDFSSKKWTLQDALADYSESYNDTITLGATPVNIMDKVGGPMMLIPQQLTGWNNDTDKTNSQNGAYLAVKLQINTVAGAQVFPFPSDAKTVWAAIPIKDNWEAGNCYVYNLDFTHGAGHTDPKDPTPGTPILDGEIKFNVDVTPWAEYPVDITPTPVSSQK